MLMMFSMMDNTNFVKSYYGKLPMQRAGLFLVEWERSLAKIYIKGANPNIFRSRQVITVRKLPGV